MSTSTFVKTCMIGGLALGVLLSGCGTTPFFFPITDQERQQVAALRAFRAAVSPQANRAMGIFQRDMLSMLSLKLPTEYGVDLTPYFVPFPKIELPPPPSGYLASIDSGKQLVGFLVPSQQISVTAQVSQPTPQAGTQATWQYDLRLLPTPLGQSGSLQVITSGADWRPTNSADNTTKPYFFGQRYTRLPDSIQAKTEFNLQQNAGKITLNASLGSFQEDFAGSGLMIPQSLSFDGSIPGLSWYLNGLMSTTTAVRLQGTLTVQGSQGSDSYIVDGTSVNGDVSLRLTNEEKAIDLSLSFREGQLKGQAKSRVDRRYILADLVPSANGKVMINYGDGTQEVLF